MTTALSKQMLKDELCHKLADDLAALERAHKATMAGATHEEAKPENDKDTRALEQSYLARGQARRVEELRVGLAEVHSLSLRAFAETDCVAMGALVFAEDGDDKISLFLAPQGGGLKLANGSVLVVTPQSPLAHALTGKSLGDVAEVPSAARTREWTIVRIE